MEEFTRRISTVLDVLYAQFIQGDFSAVTNFSVTVGGIGAILYISSRVWRSMANAEPIDLFPLFRPFALALVILGFQSVVLPTMNGFANLLSNVFIEMGEGSAEELKQARQDREDLIEGKKIDQARLESAISKGEQAQQQLASTGTLVEGFESDGGTPGTLSDSGVALKGKGGGFWAGLIRALVEYLGELVKWLSSAVELGLKVMSTFLLIFLAFIGPLVFAFSCFDGFSSGYLSWFAKYINIALWVPIAHFITIILNMLELSFIQLDIANMSSPGTVPGASSEWVMIVFHLIGFFSMLMVPTMSSWLIEAGGTAGGVNAKTASVGRGVARYIGRKGSGAAKTVGQKMANLFKKDE